MGKKAYNLIDVLLTMVVIGIIFTLTIPVLTMETIDKTIISRLGKFNSTLQDAVNEWKTQNNCLYKVGVCFEFQNKLLGQKPDFNKILQYLNGVEQINKNTYGINLLPEKTLNYYGTDISEFDFRTNNSRNVYIFLDGTIFSIASDEEGFWIVADMNGKKPPNRIGKDTFHFTIGYGNRNDVNPYARDKTLDGICGHGYREVTISCDPNNANPTIGNGASPTAYVIIKNELPDFKSLSKTVSNFKP
jgi:hypothetical protein